MAGWGSSDTTDYNGQQEPDELTQLLTYGNKGQGLEAQTAPKATALPGAQPSMGNYSTKEPDLNPPTYNPSRLPAAPNPNADQGKQLEQQIQQYGKPLNRDDYKPSLGRRLAGSLFTGMMAFGHVPNASQIGDDAIWGRYNKAEQDRETNLTNAQQQMQNFRQTQGDANQQFEREMQLHNAGNSDYNVQERAYQGQVQARDRQAQEQQRLQSLAPGTEQPDDPNNPMGGWHATTIGGQQMKLGGPPDSWLKTPTGVSAQREADVKRLNLTGDDAKFYRANGKLKEPSAQVHVHNEPAGTQEWNAYVKSLGHTPTTQDVLNYKRGQGAGGSGKMSDAQGRIILQKKNDAFTKAQDTYKKAIESAQSDADRQEAENDFLDSAELAQQNYEQQIGQRTGEEVQPFDIRSSLKASLHPGAQPAPQSQPAPQQQAPQPRTAAQPSQTQQPSATPNLPRGNGAQLDANTAKQFLQAAGGDKQKARQLAKTNGFKF